MTEGVAHFVTIEHIRLFINSNKHSLFDKHSIALAVDCHVRTAQRALAEIHEEGRLLVIVHWYRKNGAPQPVYAHTMIRGKYNAPRPEPLPLATRQAMRRAIPEVREQEAYKKRIARNGVPKLGIWNL
jgi:hypothetical protein